jgi:hypothetical protein
VLFQATLFSVTVYVFVCVKKQTNKQQQQQQHKMSIIKKEEEEEEKKKKKNIENVLFIPRFLGLLLVKQHFLPTFISHFILWVLSTLS